MRPGMRTSRASALRRVEVNEPQDYLAAWQSIDLSANLTKVNQVCCMNLLVPRTA